MTLATRCSACGTSFRVVQDQLKVSGGWVRCGRCSEVFNAIEGLYEVGSAMAEPAAKTTLAAANQVQLAETTLAPQAAPPPVPVPAPTLAAASAPAPATEASPAPVVEPGPERPIEPAAPGQRGVELATDAATAASVDESPVLATAPLLSSIQVLDAGPDREIAPAPGTHALPGPGDESAPPGPVVAPDHAASRVPTEFRDALPEPPAALDGSTPEWHGDGPTPSFIAAAERAARRQSPRARRAWAAAAVLLLGLLGLQAALAYRDVLAARWPSARAPLQQACATLGCRVEPLRYIAALSVEASGLQQVGTTAIYNLSVVLRNRSDIELMAPSMDLVLSDTQGRTIARRVLSGVDFGRTAPSIGAAAELSMQASLRAGGQRVAGYTIEIFYP